MAGSRAIEAAKAFVRLYANDEQLRAQLKGTKAHIDDLGKSLSSPLITAGLAGVAAGAVGVLKVAASAEQTAIAFEVMLGSASQAKNMLAEIYQLGKESPFSAKDFQDAGAMLLQYSITASEIVPTISMIGDVAAGNAEKLHRLTLAYGQVQAAGRLMGGEVKQMVENGFNPLQQISQRTGEDMLVLLKRMQDGKVSAAEVTQAFADATSGTGRFAGMTERMSKTTGGVYAAMADEVMMLAKSMGDTLLPVANIVLDVIRGIVATIGAWPKTVVATMVAVTALVGILKTVTLATVAYAKAQAIATALSGPKGWVVLAASLAAVAGAVALVNTQTEDVVAATQDTHDPLDTMAKDMAKVEQAAGGMGAAVAAAPKDFSALRKQVADLVDPMGQVLRSAREFADQLAEAGVTTQQGRILVSGFIENESGFTSAVQGMAEEIAKLEGVATDASIELQKMAQAGVDPGRLAQYEQMIQRRDALLKKQQDDQFYADKQKEMENAAQDVKNSIQTASQALAKERERLQVLQQAGLITSDDAQKFLEQNPEFKALMDGSDLLKTVRSDMTGSNVAQDIRSTSGVGAITSIMQSAGEMTKQQLGVLMQLRDVQKRLLTVTERNMIAYQV